MIGWKWRGRTHTVLKGVDGQEKRHPVEQLFPLFRAGAAMLKDKINTTLGR